MVRRCPGSVDEGPPVSLYTSQGWTHFPDIPYDWVEGFKGATRNFIAAIEGKEAPLLDGKAAYQVLRFALAIQRSAAARREVYLDEMDAPLPVLLRRPWLKRDGENAVRDGLVARLLGGSAKDANQ